MRWLVRTALGLCLVSALMFGDAARLSFMPAPALARHDDYDWGGRHGHGHGHDDVSVGDVILGGAIIAGIVGLFASAANNDDDDFDDWRDTAIDACADAAIARGRDEGRGDVRVRAIDTVGRDGAAWRVRGDIEFDRTPGSDDRNDRRWPDRDRAYDDIRTYFSCTAERGHVVAFRFTDDFDYAGH